MESNAILSGALGVSVFVLLYSFFCLSCSLMLVYLLWKHSNGYTYVTFVAIFTSLGTTASIIQQLHYAVDWRSIKAAQYAVRTTFSSQPGGIVTGGSQGLDLGLFWIQYYSYNVNALLILFWAITLFQGTWRLQAKSTRMRGYSDSISIASKVFAVLFPGLLFGIANIREISSQLVPFLILCNLILCVSLIGGSIFLALTLFKFIQARRSLVISHSSNTGTNHGTNDGTANLTGNGTVTGHHASATAGKSQASSNGPQNGDQVLGGTSRRQRNNDRWLIIRFTIAFVVLGIFELCVILFEVIAYNNNQTALSGSGSGTIDTSNDFSLSSTITELVQFMPGVTASLVAFLVWGTTSRYIKEVRRVLGLVFCCTSCRADRARKRGSAGLGINAAGKGISAFQRLDETEAGKGGSGKIMVTTTTELSVLSSVSHDNGHGDSNSNIIGNGPSRSASRARSASGSLSGSGSGDSLKDSEGNINSPSRNGRNGRGSAAAMRGGETMPAPRAVAFGTEQWAGGGPPLPVKERR